MGSVLTTKQFLERVWPSTGPYIVACPIIKQDGNKAYRHIACEDIDEAVHMSRSLCFADKKDVFFCVHALKTGKQFNAATQKWKVSRKHDNMREGKTLFFDLDVGDGDTKYSSREQAIASLQRFLFRTQLPDPLTVSSGGGFHVYWVLTDPIPSDQWRVYADRMRWLAYHHGMLVDPSRTTDQSSVLRVVGTQNFKPHVMAKVQAILEGDITDTTEFIALLETKTEHYTPLATLVSSAAHAARTGNMGTMYDGRQTPAEEVFEVCEQMRTFRDCNGMIPEPAWFVSVGTMRWVENGEEVVHEISKGDPRYSESETQAKIDHWSDKSVPSCHKIALEFGNDACDRCALKAKGKNPLDIANKDWAQKPRGSTTKAHLQSGPIELKPTCEAPFGFFRGNGGVFEVVHDAAQDATINKELMPYDLFPIAKYMGSRSEPGHSDWCAAIPLKGQTFFSLEDSALVDQREFGTALLANDIIVPNPISQQKVRGYMLHYLQKLQKEAQAAKVHDHYGWEYEDDAKASTKRSFVIDKRAFDIAEQKWKPAAMAANLKDGAAFMGQDGSFEGHLDALEFYNRPQYRHLQFAYLSGLSVPFFYATGEHGMVVSLTGRSGSSKSATLRAISGQWGSPERYMLSGAPDGSTHNARVDRMMTLANLPFTLDEVTNQSSEAINDMVLGSSQNGGKLRLNAKSQVVMHRGGMRHSVIYCATNTSLVTLINAQNAAGQAGLARVLEVHCAKGPTNEKTAADHAIRGLRANYGWTGPMLLEALLPDHEKIERAIQDRSDRLNKDWTMAAMERFTGGCCATMYEVAVRAYDAGLHRFDVDEVMVWFETVQLPKQREIMAAQDERSNPLEVLTTYLAQFHGEAVRIDEDGKGNLSGVLSIPTSRNLAYRYDIHNSEVWIRSEHFQRYCVERRLDVSQITRELERMKVVTGHWRKSLLWGVPNHPQLRCMCYVVDMKHPKMLSVAAQAKPVT